MKHERITQGQGEPDIAWIIAAHEAGRADPDPFFEIEENENERDS